ncbi:hypothetical protein NC652_010002 [Populus alba x Populus x berolinensis]|nr:hypothetical protein NC652_009087 [Populus alba x Populus x berolinensis]KAJ6943526.1 hypothetical protein NC652_009091 [Populus alba x Populus x berolinensis]KAJ6944826.1 hypothetical protein NC652_010002 [Populus alba x Populus x berolinensis]
MAGGGSGVFLSFLLSPLSMQRPIDAMGSVCIEKAHS